MVNFSQFLSSIKTDLSKFSNGYAAYLNEVLADAEDFVLKNQKDIELWMSELEKGKLSKADFILLLKSKKSTAEMKALQNSGLSAEEIKKIRNELFQVMAQSVQHLS